MRKTAFVLMILMMFSIISAAAPLSLPEINGTVILKVDLNKAVVNKAVTVIDEDESVVPFIQNGRTLIPLRFVTEAFGGVVTWNALQQVIDIDIDNKKIFFKIDSKTMYIGDEETELEAPPGIYNDKTFVPLRVLAEAIGKNVFYDDGWIAITKSSVEWENISQENRKKVYDSIVKDTFSKDIDLTAIDFSDFENNFYKWNPLSTNSYIKDGTVVLPHSVVPVSNYEKFKEDLKSKNIKVKKLDQPLFLSEDDVLYLMEASNKKIVYSEVESNVLDFAMGDRFAIILKKDGTVFTKTTLVTNAFFLSNKSEINFKVDTKIMHGRTIKSLKGEVASVFAGRECCFVIKTDGTLWALGSNYNGKLGDGTTTSYEMEEAVEIKGIPNPKFIASSTNHTLCIDGDGYLWGWGENSEYELTSEFPKKTLTPKRFTTISDVKYVATASDYTIVVKKDGTVWTTGDNDRGKLGVPEIRRALEFTQVPGLTNIVYAKANDNYYPTGNSSVVDENGEVYYWGTALPTIASVYSNLNDVKPIKLGLKLDVSRAVENQPK